MQAKQPSYVLYGGGIIMCPIEFMDLGFNPLPCKTRKLLLIFFKHVGNGLRVLKTQE